MLGELTGFMMPGIGFWCIGLWDQGLDQIIDQGITESVQIEVERGGAMETEPPTYYTRERGIFILLVAAYLGMVTAASLFQYHRNFRASCSRVDSVLMAAVRSLDEILGPDFHDRFTPETPINRNAYRDRVAQLNRLVEQLEIEFLYSMDMVEDQVCFVVSNETREDIDRGTPSLFYNPYPDPPEQLINAFDTLTPVFCSYTNQWNRFRSIFLPRKTPDGRVYVLAADIKAGDMAPLLRSSILISLAFAVLFLVPIVPAVVVYRRMMKKRAADLEIQLYRDPLTGLPNHNRLKASMKGVSAKNIACILLNVDAFKEALAHDRVVPFFQPILNNCTGTVERYEALVRLKKNNIQIAIDDFGSGYANFEYLLRLKADYLKIDGSLVEGVLENQASREVVAAIVSFAKNLDMALIAEYVSSEDIQAYISSLGIEYSQGFYLGFPGPKIS